MKKQTLESFIALLKKHGTLGPYIKVQYPNHVCIDGWINLEALIKELNGE